MCDDFLQVVGNGTKPNEVYWEMKNGYCLPKSPSALSPLATRLQSDPDLAEAAEQALRVGIHWDTQVTPPKTHRVAQVYASAVPVAYTKSTPAKDWQPLAQVVLNGAYEATLAAAACVSIEEQRRVRVYLTALGGGAFGNRRVWIRDAIIKALNKYRSYNLEVILVHYGTRVRTEWQDVTFENS